MRQYCKVCHETTTWQRKQALLNSYANMQGVPASQLPRGATIARVGKAQLVDVDSCVKCGRSVGAGRDVHSFQSCPSVQVMVGDHKTTLTIGDVDIVVSRNNCIGEDATSELATKLRAAAHALNMHESSGCDAVSYDSFLDEWV